MANNKITWKKFLSISTYYSIMDIKRSAAIDHFKLYEEYSREEVHNAFGDGTRYVEGAGVWGRWGVIKPKIADDVYALFCLVKPDVQGIRLQYIESSGKFHWISQQSMYPGERKLSNMISASKGNSNVFLFAKPSAGPKYTYLGRLSYISADEDSIKPTIVTWKMLSWPPPDEVMKKFGVK